MNRGSRTRRRRSCRTPPSAPVCQGRSAGRRLPSPHARVAADRRAGAAGTAGLADELSSGGGSPSWPARVPAREYEQAILEWALGYPWERPAGSYEWAEGEVLLLSSSPSPSARRRLSATASGAAHGAAAGDQAQTLRRGAGAQVRPFPAGRGAGGAGAERAPARLRRRRRRRSRRSTARCRRRSFASPGTEVAATSSGSPPPVHPADLVRADLLARPPPHPFEVADAEIAFDDVLVFVSRFGTFCPEGRRPPWPRSRPATAPPPAYSQRQLLDPRRAGARSRRRRRDPGAGDLGGPAGPAAAGRGHRAPPVDPAALRALGPIRAAGPASFDLTIGLPIRLLAHQGV